MEGVGETRRIFFYFVFRCFLVRSGRWTGLGIGVGRDSSGSGLRGGVFFLGGGGWGSSLCGGCRLIKEFSGVYFFTDDDPGDVVSLKDTVESGLDEPGSLVSLYRANIIATCIFSSVWTGRVRRVGKLREGVETAWL